MPNPNRNQRTTIGLPKTRFGVYISSSAQAKPTEADEQSTVYVESVQQFAGSGLMEAVLINDLAKQNRHLQNLSLARHASRQLEVWTLKPNSGGRDVCLFWGEIVAQKLTIRKGEESQLLIARILPDHFEKVSEKMWTFDVNGTFGKLSFVENDLEFNPIINQIRSPNMFSPDSEEDEGTFPIWIDPESVRTETSQEYVQGKGVDWTLNDIINTLTEILNPDEEFIKRPDRGYIDSKITNAPEVTDLTLRRGQYLPAILDQALQPYGYNWFVQMARQAGGDSRPSISLYQRGQGNEKTVNLQSHGENYNRIASNLEEAFIQVDISDLKNVVVGATALHQFEITTELYRAWKASDSSKIKHDDPNEPTGRKLAANEGADYDGLRPEIEIPELYNAPLVKRRVMEDCLVSRDNDRLPPFLEFSIDDGETWEDAPQQWAFRPLRNEIGVYFTAYDKDGEQAIPDEVLDTDVRFRITCTITTDRRDEIDKDAKSDSPRKNESKLFLDLSNRYQIREQAPSFAPSASQLSGDYVDEQDDWQAMHDFIEGVGANEQSANITAELPLHGILTGYSVGDLITEINGRNISLNRNTRAASQQRYLQIVGIKYTNRDNQNTILTVAPYDMYAG